MKLKSILTKKQRHSIYELVGDKATELLDYQIEGKNISSTISRKQKLNRLERWCGKLYRE